jgi:hypothetical protein
MSAHFSTPRREVAHLSFDNLQRYWNDPAFVAQGNAEANVAMTQAWPRWTQG